MSPAIRATEEKYGIKSDVLPPRLQKRLDDLLAPGEEILWQGQPDPPKSDSFGCLMLMFPFVMIPLLLCVQAIVIEGNDVGRQISHVVCWAIGIGVVLAIINEYGNRLGNNSTAYGITSSRILILKPKMSVDSIPPEQISRRKLSWDSQGYETMSLPTGETFLSVWTLPDGSSEIVVKYSYLSRLKDIRLINRLITDTFEKQQTQVSIAPINSFTFPI